MTDSTRETSRNKLDHDAKSNLTATLEIDLGTKADDSYGDLIRISPDGGKSLEILHRIPFGVTSEKGGMDESTLRDLLFDYPNTLPIRAIDTAYAHPVAVCRELSTGAGFIDAVYVNPLGRLILAEFKLWRNPQARREVIGQILDYAKELASWKYEDLQREVSRSLGRTGNVLYELVKEIDADLDESAFVDNVSRQLARGEFLLLIVGDGIREGVANIVDFVQQYSGLHFSLALVEAALYRDSDKRIVVQPRCLARTEVVQRFVVEGGVVEHSEEALSPGSTLEHAEENRRFWTAVLRNFEFSDVTVDVPEATSESSLFIKVRNSGFGDWGLTFAGFLYRNSPSIGCYLTCRKGIEQAERIYHQLLGELNPLKAELGEDLDHWTNPARRPRLGFNRTQRLPFPDDGEESFDESVSWMRERLDLLVSVLNPRLQRALRYRA